MNLLEAEQLAWKLLSEHRMELANGHSFTGQWGFKWTNKKRALGTCHYSERRISLSQFFVPHLDVDEVKDTILHEIAHAIVGGKHGHDYVWKRKASELGCNPDRTADVKIPVNKMGYKYIAECPVCHKKHGHARKSRREYSCSCQGNFFNRNTLLNYVQQY